WMDVAAALGFRTMRTVAGGPSLRPRVGAELRNAVAPLAEASAHARTAGLELALENHGELTAAQVAELLERVGEPALGVCFGAEKPAGAVRLGSLGRRLPDELGVIIALLVIVAVIGIPHSDFLQPYNLLRIMSSYAPYGMIACGMVYLLALGEIDLSVGWNWNFSAVITAKAMIAGVNPWLAALLGVLFGAGLGLVNGLLTVLL